ncbi:YnhF family membrane protein [Vibrio tapetis subsp. quintayensis]|nr:YnhF family membrane protein [Vibrio tapetis]MDN3682328.1 YnhF family membrane protein [Vibrio tapetis subsp. quintayensis]
MDNDLRFALVIVVGALSIITAFSVIAVTMM